MVLGLLSSVLLVTRVGDKTVVVLLILSIWSFCRFYYFAFYVIEHYVDPNYRYSGLLSLVVFLFRRTRTPATKVD